MFLLELIRFLKYIGCTLSLRMIHFLLVRLAWFLWWEKSDLLLRTFLHWLLNRCLTFLLVFQSILSESKNTTAFATIIRSHTILYTSIKHLNLKTNLIWVGIFKCTNLWCFKSAFPTYAFDTWHKRRPWHKNESWYNDLNCSSC